MTPDERDAVTRLREAAKDTMFRYVPTDPLDLAIVLDALPAAGLLREAADAERSES